jgi:hypothetical protein
MLPQGRELFVSGLLLTSEFCWQQKMAAVEVLMKFQEMFCDSS